LQRTLKVKWNKVTSTEHTKESLQKIFGAFGSIQQILLKGENAVIVYDHVQPAILGERTMNNHPIYQFKVALASKDLQGEDNDEDASSTNTVQNEDALFKAHEDFEAQVLAKLKQAAKDKPNT